MQVGSFHLISSTHSSKWYKFILLNKGGPHSICRGLSYLLLNREKQWTSTNRSKTRLTRFGHRGRPVTPPWVHHSPALYDRNQSEAVRLVHHQDASTGCGNTRPTRQCLPQHWRPSDCQEDLIDGVKLHRKLNTLIGLTNLYSTHTSTSSKAAFFHASTALRDNCERPKGPGHPAPWIYSGFEHGANSVGRHLLFSNKKCMVQPRVQSH